MFEMRHKPGFYKKVKKNYPLGEAFQDQKICLLFHFFLFWIGEDGRPNLT